jgi:hypothetical protein
MFRGNSLWHMVNYHRCSKWPPLTSRYCWHHKSHCSKLVIASHKLRVQFLTITFLNQNFRNRKSHLLANWLRHSKQMQVSVSLDLLRFALDVAKFLGVSHFLAIYCYFEFHKVVQLHKYDEADNLYTALFLDNSGTCMPDCIQNGQYVHNFTIYM